MVTIKETINRILRDHGILDNGVSDVIAECVESMTLSVVREQLNFANACTEAMNGYLANPEVGDEVNYDVVAEMSINQAEALFKKLDERMQYNADKSTKLDS